jgi:hypothetical protein
VAAADDAAGADDSSDVEELLHAAMSREAAARPATAP